MVIVVNISVTFGEGVEKAVMLGDEEDNMEELEGVCVAAINVTGSNVQDGKFGFAELKDRYVLFSIVEFIS